MLLKSKATKVIAWLCIMALAITTIIPQGFVMPKVWAEGTGTTWDFRDGSVIPTDTDGKSDVTSGNLTVKVGTQNAYQYNGNQHGVAFKAGNSIEIKVDGSTKLIVGDCSYSNAAELTVKSADGTYTETKATKTGCYHNDESAMVYTYTGGATTLIIEFTNTTYVPIIIAEPIASAESWDFRDGSVIPTDTDGKSDVTSGNLTVKVGTQNAYQYNGNQHGVAFKAGNSIEIKVSGPTKLIVGDCSYSNATELTVTSANGAYSETLATKTGCYHNDESALVYKYTGGATTLVIEFTNTTYVPIIIAEPLLEDIPDENGAKKDTVYVYNFSGGDILSPDDFATTVLNGSATSKDGFVTITSAGKAYWHDNQHGIVVCNGDVIEVKVAGDSYISFNLCEYGADTDATIVASTTKGEFIGETSQPLMKKETDGLSMVAFEYKGVATTLKFTVKAADGELYLHGMQVSNKPEEVDPPKAVGNGKIDAWDFGAEKLDESKYNNKLTADIINSWYKGVAAGTSGVTIGSFSTDELFFNAGGKTNNRIRTTNTALTRYDENAKKIGDVAYPGYVYSNNSGPNVHLAVKLYEGDILTVYTNSNGGDSTIYCVSPSGEIQEGKTGANGAILTFYASEYGLYRIFSVEEKLVVFRVLREHTTPTEVTGTVDITDASGIDKIDYKLSFENTATGEVIEAEVVNGKYSVYLNDCYEYYISLIGANGYVVSSENTFELKKGAGKTTQNIKIKSVDLAKVTGKITGLDSSIFGKFGLEFINKDKIYVPEITINSDGTFTLYLEQGVTYTVSPKGTATNKNVPNNVGINDYELKSSSKTISASADVEKNIEFAAKAVYDITTTYKGLPDSVKSKVTLVFTNINEEGYVYTFAPGEKVQLRDGQYSVLVKGYGEAAVIQKLTSDLKVNGKAASKEVTFEAISLWDFAKYNTSNGGTPGIDPDRAHYLGLQLVNGQENKTYLLMGADGEIKIPVTKGQIVTLTYCYSGTFEINGTSYTTENSTGSTGKTDVVKVTAAEDGYLTVSVKEQTYFNSIEVATPTAYKSKITVGKDKNYQTINDALAAVAKMDRPNNERVEIVIDPGNYEEMLVINVPNVSLVNAAGKNSSLSIIDKGVNIAKNVVRITSYYGHGYDYYSMGSDSKWNADVLETNKANGSYTTKNPGSGTTNGSYWNSTVVVYANGFEANGIVFENSFNQYISKKESEDTVVMWASGSKGQRPTTYGDTSVQTRSFVERAGALAIVGDNSVFVNCKFIGRQDTLYGGANIKAAFHKCDILGAVDYIYGGMTAVFFKCNLVMNTDDKTASDQAYLTAAQQTSGRGYLMYECTVTSTTPGVDTASATRSKPGYFGRPWQAATSEVVFYKTIVETTDYPDAAGKSLIVPAGWNNTLGGESNMMYEYGTIELSGENNTASRAAWTTILTEPKINGEEITIAMFLGEKWTKELQDRGLLTVTTLYDGETDVFAEVDEGSVPDGTKLSADLVESNDKEYVYDIKFIDKDGKEIQPGGKVTIRIPLPEKFAGKKVYVYRVVDNEYEDMNAYVDGDYVKFTTDHFSTYVLTTEVKGSAESPETGVMPIVPIAAVVIISAALALFFIIKKTRKA